MRAEEKAFAMFRDVVRSQPGFPPAEFSLVPYEDPLCELESCIVPLHRGGLQGFPWRCMCVVNVANATESETREVRRMMRDAVKRVDVELFYQAGELRHLVSSAMHLPREGIVRGAVVFGLVE